MDVRVILDCSVYLSGKVWLVAHHYYKIFIPFFTYIF